MPELTAGIEDAGLRLDVFVARYLPEVSRSRAQQLLESGGVRLAASGGALLAKNHRVTPGEVYSVTLPQPVPALPQPEDIPLDILYEDEYLLVLNKPKGMVVHPAPGHERGTLVSALLYHCGGSLSGVGGVLRPGIVHRLDKDTSGLMLAAKNDLAHAALSAQLADRSLSRVYEAVLRGSPKADTGTVDAPVGRHPTERKKMAVNVKNGRRAVTRWEVLARYPGYSHVRCKLETGRTHQIRVHMASLGHPVAGDALYGGGGCLGLTSQCLHAKSIRFRHPATGAELAFDSALPPEFAAVLAALSESVRDG